MTVENQKYTQQHARLGWSAEEDALLFEAVGSAREGGASLKAVFDSVAARTGRRPNSIRNYYYARVKQEGNSRAILPHNPAFVPFSDEEIHKLLVTVLTAQAKGMSVRACTLQMGNGDNRAMLRYQNKYRSLLKSNPAWCAAWRASCASRGSPPVIPLKRPPRCAAPEGRASRREACWMWWEAS